MKKRFALGLSALALLTMSGCSHITMLRTEELRIIQAENDSLHNELVALQERLAEEEAERFKTFQINQELALQRIEEKIDRLSGNVNESQERITQISQTTGELTLHMREKARQDSLATVQAATEQNELYQAANGSFQAGKYQEALDGFTAFMETYPESEQVSEALYWKAESFLALMKLEDAEIVFKQYIKENPEGTLQCTALFKLGVTYDRMEKEQHRDYLWKQLQERCPDSDEAKLIKARQ